MKKNGILINVIVAVISIIGTLLFVKFWPDNSQSITKQTIMSEPITWGDSQDLMNEYKHPNNNKKLKVNVEENMGQGKKKTLEGFNFDVEHIEKIIHQNLGLPLGERPEKLIIFFGKKGEFEEEDGSIRPPKREKFPNMHFIAIGAKEQITEINKIKDTTFILLNRNLLDPTSTDASIYDKANPCPPCKTQ